MKTICIKEFNSQNLKATPGLVYHLYITSVAKTHWVSRGKNPLIFEAEPFSPTEFRKYFRRIP